MYFKQKQEKCTEENRQKMKSQSWIEKSWIGFLFLWLKIRRVFLREIFMDKLH